MHCMLSAGTHDSDDRMLRPVPKPKAFTDCFGSGRARLLSPFLCCVLLSACMVDDDSRLGHNGGLPSIRGETDTDTDIETDIGSTSDAESLSKTDGGAGTGTMAEINHSWRLVNFWS